MCTSLYLPAVIAINAVRFCRLRTNTGARSYFALTRLQFVLSIYLPAAVPSLVTGLHLALIYAWLATIGAEYFMAAGPGIGGLIISGRERFEMDLVMLGIIVVGTVGFTVDRGAAWLEQKLIPWQTA